MDKILNNTLTELENLLVSYVPSPVPLSFISPVEPLSFVSPSLPSPNPKSTFSSFDSKVPGILKVSVKKDRNPDRCYPEQHAVFIDGFVCLFVCLFLCLSKFLVYYFNQLTLGHP